MKLCVTPFHLDDIEVLINNGADIILLGNEQFANRLNSSFTIDEIQVAANQIHHLEKELFVNINLIVHHDDLEPLNQFLDELIKANVDGILFSDLAVYQLAKEKGIVNKLIYHPETLITNTFDSLFWHKQGIKGVIIAKEITLDDIKLIIDTKHTEIGLIGHGQLNMFHSRRPLVENFMKYNDQDYKQVIASKNLRLVEELRSEVYPIVQDNHGTHIFRDKTLESFLEINELTNLDYFIIDGLFRDQAYVVEMVQAYNILRKNYDQTYAKKLREKYQEDHDQGFYYKKTVYDKF
jgi:putative protease